MSWDVDASSEASSFVGYLDTFGAVPGVDDVRRALLAGFGPRPGESWLDVGCGIGDDAVVLAEMLSPGGWVVAVDASATMIEECRRRIPRGARVETQVADAHALPFAAATFDGVLANRVLQHVPDPAVAVAEMLRVTRSGATVAMVEPDWDTFAVEPSGGRTGEAIVPLRSAGVANPRMGRDLDTMLRAAGAREINVVTLELPLRDYPLADALYRLEETAARAVAAGAVSAGEADAWVASLRSAADDGRFCASVTVSVARSRTS